MFKDNPVIMFNSGILFMKNAIQGIAKCMSPLSLILVGSILAQEVKFKFDEDIKIIGMSIYRQILAFLGFVA